MKGVTKIGGLCLKTAALRASKERGFTGPQRLGLGFTELPNVTVTGQCHVHCSLVFAFGERGLGVQTELQTEACRVWPIV